jgi:hypothetical protein
MKTVVGQLRGHEVLGNLDAVVEVANLVAGPGRHEHRVPCTASRLTI